MEYIAFMLSKTLEVFKLPLTVGGFSFSFWEVFCFVIVAGIVCYFVGGFFNGD